MEEQDHDKIARRLLEEVFGKEDAEERTKEREGDINNINNEVIVEKEQPRFYPEEALAFLLGERESRGNLFQGEEAGFFIYMVRANTAEGDLFIGFSMVGKFLCISLHKLQETWDDPDRNGAKIVKITKYGERHVFLLQNILRVGFCIEIKASGGKMRFMQFGVRESKRNLEFYRVYDHGEIFKW